VTSSCCDEEDDRDGTHTSPHPVRARSGDEDLEYTMSGLEDVGLGSHAARAVEALVCVRV
jgi:hypothetical protein